ncbi:hypothetical protein JYU20_00710 [Bacteroidales bacterium AH-315-I05]|nr:hypothetical protein [Bacteroidales bacterium AH-315-I05]
MASGSSPHSPIKKTAINIAVANYFEVPFAEMKKKHGGFRKCFPRHAARWIMKRQYNMSVNEISLYFEVSHVAIIHSLKTVDNLIETNAEIKKTMNDLKLIFKEKTSK